MRRHDLAIGGPSERHVVCFTNDSMGTERIVVHALGFALALASSSACTGTAVVGTDASDRTDTRTTNDASDTSDAALDTGSTGDASIDIVAPADVIDAGGASDVVDRDANRPAPLDPARIPHFVQPLVIPPVMPPESSSGGVAEYHIAVRQISQQVLPAPLPRTTVWAYGRESDPNTFNYPGFTVETRSNSPVRVRWVNGLVDAEGRHLAHILPIDNTLHWADPEPASMRTAPGVQYTGPVPIVTHVHGAHVASHSDGNPDAWFLPAANDIPSGFVTHGSVFATQRDDGPGNAVFFYPNDQRAGTSWYHDHALGLTRLNVYAGLAGFWLIRDDVEDALGLPGPAPRLGDAPGTRYYEIPIAIQDRSFSSDGSLRYPASRSEFGDYDGPYAPASGVPPVWVPEAFGDVMVVNGRAWPSLDVEPRRYRLRLLNGTDGRFLILAFDRAGIRFTQIGNEGGLLGDSPVVQDRVRLGPAERADVIVDFGSLAAGDRIVLRNLGPDEPYRGPDANQPPARADTTGQVMQFRVVAPNGPSSGNIPTALPVITPLVANTTTPRDLILGEVTEPGTEVPIRAMLGTVHDGLLMYGDPITEQPYVGDTEVWRLANLTPDAHPMHLHEVAFQVVDRQPFDAERFAAAEREYVDGHAPEPRLDDYFTGPAQQPEPWERGWKDTVPALPGMVTRVIANFDREGLYVWHCHILEHEDNEMMRPYRVIAR